MKVAVAMVVLILAVAVGLVAWWRPFRGSDELVLPGVVEIQEVRVASRVGGRVARVLVREGELVEAGKILVVLEQTELKAQRGQRQAQLEAAQADLKKAQRGPREEEKEAALRAVEAARARWQRAVKGPREEEKREAQAAYEAAQADVVLAREDLARAERAFQKQAMTRADLDTARAGLDRSRARADTARARLDLLLAGTRPEDIAEAQAELKKAEANYDLLKNGTRSEDLELAAARVLEAQAKLDEADADLAELEIKAPEAAVLDVLAIRPGDVLPPNAPVARLLRRDDLWVKVYVPETQLGRVRLGQPVSVTCDAYPGRTFAGAVIHIAAISEFTPRNVQSPDERRHQVFGVKVRVNDPEGVFKAGMAAEVRAPLS